jgi:uncharacterized lipoprotein YmbA
MKRSHAITVRIMLAAGFAGSAGCSLSRDTPDLERYVLTGAAPHAAAPHDPGGITLGMRRLDLAAYLAIPAIVVRRGEHGIGASEYHRWGEDLSLSISRAMTSHLVAASAIAAVNTAPWPARTEHDFLLQLHVARFEGVADSAAATLQGAAQVAATWEVLRPSDGLVLARGATAYRQDGWRIGDYAALVLLLEEGLAGVARDVVACVQRINVVAQSSALPLACGV